MRSATSPPACEPCSRKPTPPCRSSWWTTARLTPPPASSLAASDPRLELVEGQPLPEGWAGKPYALAQGAARAQGEWLCFIDADTFASPELIASTYAAARQAGAGLLTILTAQELCTFWEKVLLPIVFTGLAVGFPPDRVNDPATPDAIANGQFLLFDRAVYAAIGGHAAVRSSIVEDRDLARRVKRMGYRLVVANGSHLARTRMYTRFSEIWEGWTKNIFIGLSGDRRLIGLGFVGIFLALVAALVLPAWLIWGLLGVAGGGGLPAVIILGEAVVLWALLLGTRGAVSHAMGISPFYALTLPLGSLIFAAMMASSAIEVLSGRGVTWKGRRYRV